MNSCYEYYNFEELNSRLDYKYVKDYEESIKIKSTFPMCSLKKIATEGKDYFDVAILSRSHNKVGRLLKLNEKTNNSLMLCLDVNKIDKEFFTKIYESKFIQKQVQALSWGLDMQGLNFKDVEKLRIPIPPLSEQQRTLPLIKDKIKTLENAVKNLEKEKEKNTRKLKIDNILKEFGIDNTLTKINFKNTLFGYIDFEKAKEELSVNKLVLDSNNLNDLPNDYKLVPIYKLVRSNIITEIKDGNHGELHPKKNDYVNNGIPFIMANDLNADAMIDIKNCHKISQTTKDTLRTGFAKRGDVFLTHKGTVGLVAIFDNEKYDEAVLTPQVTYYRFNDKQKELSKEYFAYYLQSSNFQDLFLEYARQSTRNYVGILKQQIIKIIIPPYYTQLQIVDRIDTILSEKNMYDDRIKSIQNTIDNDLNKYILSGYSEDLFKLPEGE